MTRAGAGTWSDAGAAGSVGSGVCTLSGTVIYDLGSTPENLTNTVVATDLNGIDLAVYVQHASGIFCIYAYVDESGGTFTLIARNGGTFHINTSDTFTPGNLPYTVTIEVVGTAVTATLETTAETVVLSGTSNAVYQSNSNVALYGSFNTQVDSIQVTSP